VALGAGVAVRTMIPARAVERPPFSLPLIRENYATILGNPLAKYCYGAVAVEGAFIYGFLPYVAALLEERGAGSVREAGFVVAGIGVGGLVFNLVLPGLLRHASRVKVMRAGGAVIFLGMAGVAAGTTWLLEMAAFTVVGLGFYMLHTGIQIEATELAPTARGSAVALHAFSLFFGMAIGPLFYGFALPRIGAPLAVTLGGAAVLAAALLISAEVARKKG
jgi:predicted MFS family arabinose efflux permease